MSKNSGNYVVGYGKPPKNTRFKEGTSGNPKGRHKGTKNLKTDLAEELAEQIHLTEGGRKITISKQRAVLKGLMIKAVKGDTGAAKAIFGLVERLLWPDDENQEKEQLSPGDQEILDLYLARTQSTTVMENKDKT